MNALSMKIGTRLDLDIINSMGNKIGQTYVSQLLSVEDKQNISIACPIQEARFAFIPVSTPVRVTYMDEKYGFTSFTGTISGKHKDGNIMSFTINITSGFERIQRRKFYRLDCTLDVLYRVITEEDNNEAEEHNDDNTGKVNNGSSVIEYKKASSRNISGNGICIVTAEKIEKGTLVEAMVKIREDISIKVTCSVIRVSILEKGRFPRYELGFEFKDIDKHSEAALIKFIFEEQKRIIREKPADRTI